MALLILHSFCDRFKLYKDIFECYTESCEVNPVGDEEMLKKIRGAETFLTPERWASMGDRGRHAE